MEIEFVENLEEYWLMIENNLIYFYVKRKRIKNMYMRFSEEGKLVVTTSKTCKLEKIEEFIKAKSSWIIKQIKDNERISHDRENEEITNNSILYFLGRKYTAMIISGKKNDIKIKDSYIVFTIKENFISNAKYIKKEYNKWLKKECLKTVLKYTEIYYEKMKKYNVPFPEIEIKIFKAKWGCCIPKKNKVEFAMNLIKVPENCIEYVVVHELAHFKYIHHDRDFYNFVSLFIPDWKTKRNFLNKKYSKIIL